MSKTKPDDKFEQLEWEFAQFRAAAAKPRHFARLFSRANVLLGALLGALAVGSALYAVTVPNTFSDGTVISAADINANFTALAEGGVPEGTVLTWAGTPPPAGYLLCDGAEVSRATYAALFTAIGTAWGTGDGSTTFHLPDLRGRFLRGVDGAVGNDPDAGSRTAINTGGNTGDLVGSVQADEIISHTHLHGAAPIAQSGSDRKAAQVGNAVVYDATTATGGSETRPKNAYVNYIIKY